MKLKLLTLALAFATVPAYAAMGTTDIPTFAGQAAAAEASKKATPATPEAWLERMTDFTRNLSAFKDPKVFLPWSNAVTEPAFYVAMLNGMMDPGGWLNMMNSMAHPDAVRNIIQFADPAIYVRWTLASLDPAFYGALLTQLSDPGKLMRWAMLPADPKAWNLLLNTLNPNTYIRWGMSPLDPRAWNLMGTVANPALYTGMLGAVINPYSYGQGSNSWLSWTPAPSVQGAGSFSMWDPVAMLGNLSGYIPGLNTLSLPSLPNIGIPTFPVTSPPNIGFPTFPVMPLPAPAPIPAPEVKPAVPAPVPVPASVPEAKPAAPAAAAPAVVAPKAEVKPAAPAVAQAAPKTEVKPAAPAAAPLAPTAEAQPVPAANKVILAGDALFKSGKSGIKDLSKEGKAKLDEVVAKLKGMGEIEQIKIVGHADPTGKTSSNLKLSEARAKSVKSYLIAKGVKPNVIITSGMGDTQPVVQCAADLAKAQLKECHAPNRRVEIEIVAKPK